MAKRKRLDRRIGLGGVGMLVALAASTMSACESAVGLATIGFVAVTVSPDSVQLSTGDTLRLQGTATDSDGVGYAGATILWTSSDATVAAVSQSGLVTATGTGTANITAQVLGLKGTASITVVNPPLVVLASGVLNFAATAAGPDPQDQVVALSNGGGGVLESVSVGAVNYGTSPSSGWLTADVSPAQDQLVIRISVTGLAVGSYSATVSVGILGSSDATLTVNLVIS